MRRYSQVVIPGVVSFLLVLTFVLAGSEPGRSVDLSIEVEQSQLNDFETAAARAAVPFAAVTRSEGGRLSATLAPAGQLLALPRGTRSVEIASVSVDLAGGGSVDLAPGLARAGKVMIMRGLPLAPVAFDPGALPQEADAVRLELIARDAGGRALSADSDPDVGQEGLARLLGQEPPGAANHGGYLIVTIPDFVDALQPLVGWKTACGYDVHLVTTAETGATATSIRDYVRNAYETWDTPPLYLLIVGDVEQIPTFNALDNVNDHLYACVDGDDFIADLYVGRLSAKTVGHVQLQVAKTVGYESDPDTSGTAGQESTWFDRALLVAGNSGSSTPKPISRWIRSLLADLHYSSIDSVYYPPFWDGKVPITYYVDRGVSLVSYRGWAQGDTAWQPPGFGVTSVQRLNNGWKLPVVFSIVCHTNNFGNYDYDCFGESWLKAGTVEEPCGGVAFMGTGEHFSHTRWNDRIMMAVFDLVRYDGLRQMGPIMVAAKNTLLAEFPTEIYMDEGGEESVEYYHYIYNLLGDPSLEMWTALPRLYQISGLPRSLSAGANYLTLCVTEEDSSTPIPNASLAFTQDGALIGYGETDASGCATVSLDLASTGDITCTVTGENLYPQQLAIPVLTDDFSLTCVGADVVSGQALPGSEIEVRLSARNTGSSQIDGCAAVITGPNDVELLSDQVAFPAVAPGEEVQSIDTFRLRLLPAMENGRNVSLFMSPRPGGGGELGQSEFRLTSAAPTLVCIAQSDGADNIFSPGEEVQLVLTLRNNGSAGAGGFEARLQCAVPGQITLVDSLATLSEIAPGLEATTATDPFIVRIPASTAIGTVIPLSINEIFSDGPTGTTPFNLVVGQVDFAAPIGPVSGGYYAYDSADIDYPGQAPAYRWIECSPSYGGSGQRVPITLDNYGPKVVELPFDFTFYGQSFDSILVSDNGWIALDTSYWYDVRNWSLPSHWGGGSQIAAFWDNLDPTVPGTDGIFTWYDEANHLFVIEWSRMQIYREEGWPANYADDIQTFEMILEDPQYHGTASGNGEFIFQYHQIVDSDYMRMFSTVGFEDPTEEIGLQYCYCSLYAPGAAPLAAGLAIKFTTEPPVYDPLRTRMMIAQWSPNGGDVSVRWTLSDDRPLTGFELWRSSIGAEEPTGQAVRVDGGQLDPTAAEFRDVTADPASGYRYELIGIGAAGTRRSLGETYYLGLASVGTSLQVLGPNPAASETAIYFRSGGSGAAAVSVYDSAGRRVRVLFNETSSGPTGGVLPWDGRDAAGHRVPSGLYWVRLETAASTKTARLVVLR